MVRLERCVRAYYPNNSAAVLDVIQRKRGISRVELISVTGLTQTAISKITISKTVADLIQIGFGAGRDPNAFTRTTNADHRCQTKSKDESTSDAGQSQRLSEFLNAEIEHGC